MPPLNPLPAPTISRPAFRIAINGYGRIGRCYLRALHEAGLSEHFRVVAINEPADLASIAYTPASTPPTDAFMAQWTAPKTR